MKLRNKIKLFYVTVGSETEADKIATALVEEELAACANIFCPSTAIYRWEGKINKEKEVVLIFKTTSSLVQESLQRVLELHSYECPAVIVMDIQDGNKKFLNWINESTR